MPPTQIPTPLPHCWVCLFGGGAWGRTNVQLTAAGAALVPNHGLRVTIEEFLAQRL
jgi:hypothetical protein